MSDELPASCEDLENKTPKNCLPIPLGFYFLIAKKETNGRAAAREKFILAKIVRQEGR
jgi:hypothetical protein